MQHRCKECTLLRCDEPNGTCAECFERIRKEILEDTVELPVLEEGAIASWAYDMVYGPICKTAG
jgi:hypothetical protein